MKVSVIAALATVGLFCQQATAQTIHQMNVPGAHCIPQNASAAADISYGTAGRVTNAGASTQTVICTVPIRHAIGSSDFVEAYYEATASTACTLRLTYFSGSAAKSTSVTSSATTLILDGTGLSSSNVTANLRCAIPAGQSLNAMQLNVYNY